ncbi:uncharacterized protein [Physcomitrium patens]|uniref:Uncharacterized protein n=1 Tax=Physcomitrium patens TaxID=3218 RepID=A9T7H4_PHYPA|nr:hypothetical protein PHYPA_029118 [Physcomitrium patens]
MVHVSGGPERPVSPACNSKSGEGRKCICKVCTCGFHKCPQKHTSVFTKFGDKTISEYCAKYPQWPVPQKFIRKVPPSEHANLRMASETTYSDDFVKHPFGPAASRRPTQLTTQTGVLQKETTYNTSYWDKSKQMQPRVKMQPEKHGSGAKFSGQSLYSVEFTNPGRQPPSKVVRHGDSLGSHGAKFDSDSTYHDDYRQWKIPAKHLHRRPDNPQPTGKIEGPTTYQADYQNRKIPNQCPVSVGSKPSIVCGDHMCY